MTQGHPPDPADRQVIGCAQSAMRRSVVAQLTRCSKAATNGARVCVVHAWELAPRSIRMSSSGRALGSFSRLIPHGPGSSRGRTFSPVRPVVSRCFGLGPPQSLPGGLMTIGRAPRGCSRGGRVGRGARPSRRVGRREPSAARVVPRRAGAPAAARRAPGSSRRGAPVAQCQGSIRSQELESVAGD